MKRIVGIAFGLLLGAACGTSGSGTIVEDPRDLSGFDRIEVDHALQVVITVDPTATQSVVVRYDDNLLDQIVTRLDGTTLILEMDGSMSVGEGDRAVVVVTDRLVSLSVGGASSVNAGGSLDAYSLHVEGAASVDARRLLAGDVDLEVEGASSVTVFASDSVRGSVEGASSVLIVGDPADVDVDENQASSVTVE